MAVKKKRVAWERVTFVSTRLAQGHSEAHVVQATIDRFGVATATAKRYVKSVYADWLTQNARPLAMRRGRAVAALRASLVIMWEEQEAASSAAQRVACMDQIRRLEKQLSDMEGTAVAPAADVAAPLEIHLSRVPASEVRARHDLVLTMVGGKNGGD